MPEITDRQAWAEWIASHERMIKDWQRQMEMFESGQMSMHEASPETGGKMVDTTQERIKWTKDKIAEMRALIDKNKHRAE